MVQLYSERTSARVKADIQRTKPAGHRHRGDDLRWTSGVGVELGHKGLMEEFHLSGGHRGVMCIVLPMPRAHVGLQALSSVNEYIRLVGQ